MTLAENMSGPPPDRRADDNNHVPGLLWAVEITVGSWDEVRSGDSSTSARTYWETQGDAIGMAWATASGLCGPPRLLPMRPVGRGGRWQGSDGETAAVVTVYPVNDPGDPDLDDDQDDEDSGAEDPR